MTWSLFALLFLCLGSALAALLRRRAELARMGRSLDLRAQARAIGSHGARLLRPEIDARRCLGCGACVEACPEEGVLGMLHGQAVVLHGARCVGHNHCAEACPVGAVAVTLADLEKREDIPWVAEDLSVPGQRGLYLAGEVTGRPLIRNAVEQGRAVAARVSSEPRGEAGELDLVVVGAGPAGLACALDAHSRGLSVELLDQEPLGGTIAQFPRTKLVLTRPVELPGFGRLDRESYSREQLIEIWQGVVAASGLRLAEGVRFLGGQREGEGWRIDTSTGPRRARHLCLAVGRRGSPRKLDVPGADAPWVHHALIDARAHRGQRILVVGGGDSAVEVALALAVQPQTQVTLSYRRPAFFRLHERNAAAIRAAQGAGRVRLMFDSRVTRIHEGRVELAGSDGSAIELDCDEVFTLLGGEAPVPLLESLGVSFEPLKSALHRPMVQNRSLLRSLATACLVAGAFFVWAFWFRDYYSLPLEQRPLSEWHGRLRPSGWLGLTLGIIGVLLVVINLLYLARRARVRGFAFASLSAWMGVHVVTGICALLVALLHAGMHLGNTTGGHATWALAVVVATGAVGRYLYAHLPRAANGRELELEEVRSELEDLRSRWEELAPALGADIVREVEGLVAAGHWSGPLPKRFGGWLLARWRLDRSLERLRRDATSHGLAPDQITELVWLVERAHRAALGAAHFEDLRAVLAGWRGLHRWIALLMVLLLGAHVIEALRFGGLFD
ncbi:MAG: NAD(P)-binding domain-containing protein [Planctomycetes bacterium]|nr:NAD(P)-binding domain-containing protein [Planctomycetota bacterium]